MYKQTLKDSDAGEDDPDVVHHTFETERCKCVSIAFVETSVSVISVGNRQDPVVFL